MKVTYSQLLNHFLFVALKLLNFLKGLHLFLGPRVKRFSQRLELRRCENDVFSSNYLTVIDSIEVIIVIP
jgi:hypothetical protein